MSNREIIEWLKKAEAVPMPGSRKMYQAAAKALEAQKYMDQPSGSNRRAYDMGGTLYNGSRRVAPAAGDRKHKKYSWR